MTLFFTLTARRFAMTTELMESIGKLADQIDTGELDIIDSEFKMRAGRHGIQKALENGDISDDEAERLEQRLRRRTPKL